MQLSQMEVRWAGVIGRALLPPGMLGGVVDQVDIGERWQDECRRSRWDGAFLCRLVLWLGWLGAVVGLRGVCAVWGVLWLVWLAPLWMLRGFGTFGGLDEKARVEVLEAIFKSPRYLLRMAGLFL